MLHPHDLARSYGVVSLFAHASLTAQPFFRRFGFLVEKEQRSVIRDVELENAIMRKVLTDERELVQAHGSAHGAYCQEIISKVCCGDI